MSFTRKPLFARLVLFAFIAALLWSQDMASRWPFVHWTVYHFPSLSARIQSQVKLHVLHEDGRDTILPSYEIYSIDDDSSSQWEGAERIEALASPDPDYRRERSAYLVRHLALRGMDDIQALEAYNYRWDVVFDAWPMIDYDQPLWSRLSAVYSVQREALIHYDDRMSLLMLHFDGQSYNAPVVQPCDTLSFRSIWTASASPALDYHISLQASMDGARIQTDGMLADFPSSSWHLDRDVRDLRSLSIPCDAQPGHYDLDLILYDADSVLAVDAQPGTRLPFQLTIEARQETAGS